MNPNRGASSRRFVLSVLVLVSMLVGCNKNSTSPTVVIINTPVAVSVTNAFTFTIDASGYSANAGYDLSFNTDSLVYSLVVSNFNSGNASVAVSNLTGGVTMRDSVFSNKVNTIIQSGTGIPKRCTLGFQNFTGRLTLALTSNQTKH